MKKLICFSVVCYAFLFASAQTDLTNTGTLFIGSSTDTFSMSGNFTNLSTGALTNNAKLFVKGNFTNQQPSTTVGTGELIVHGTGTQSITTTSTSPFYKLTIDKTTGLARLGSAITVNHTLGLTAGKLSLTDYHLTMGSSALISGGGSSNYIVAVGTGELRQQISALSSKMFPVGTSTAYTPVSVDLAVASTTDMFHVRILPAVFSNGTSGSQMMSNSVNATWMVSESVNGGSDATLTCEWPASLELTGFNRVFSRLAHYTSSNWDYGLMNIAATGSNPYSVSRAGFTSFSPFSVTMQMAILPAGSLELSGKNNGYENLIDWSSASEQHAAFYAIESSLNGTDFTEEGRVKAAGSGNSLRKYHFVHQQINDRSFYYRIKQVDIDGKSVYSRTIRINIAAFRSAKLYPNPVKDKTTISFSIAQSTSVTATITTASGLQIYQFNQRFPKGDQKMNVDLTALPAGSYLFQLKDDSGTVQTFQFIKIN